MKRIAVVAGGRLSKQLLDDIKSHEVIVGVDRGGWWLLTHNIIPHTAIGDFDSVTPEELKTIKERSPNVVQYNAEKNETDLELGIEYAVSLQPTQISVYGGTGSRLDQTLAGFFLLEKFHTIDITFHDESNEISIINKKKNLPKSLQFPYCSFLPLTTKAVVTLEGFKYPLAKGTLYRTKTMGISNELSGESGTITVHSGTVLCVRSRG